MPKQAGAGGLGMRMRCLAPQSIAFPLSWLIPLVWIEDPLMLAADAVGASRPPPLMGKACGRPQAVCGVAGWVRMRWASVAGCRAPRMSGQQDITGAGGLALALSDARDRCHRVGGRLAAWWGLRTSAHPGRICISIVTETPIPPAAVDQCVCGR